MGQGMCQRLRLGAYDLWKGFSASFKMNTYIARSSLQKLFLDNPGSLVERDTLRI